MYHNKRQKTANFTGTSSISQSIFTSLSHSAIIVTYVLLVVNCWYETFFGRKQPFYICRSSELPRAPGRARTHFQKWQKRGVFTMGVWEFASAFAQRARRATCQVLVIHSLWITMGVWEFGSLDQLQKTSGRPGD